MNARRRLLKLMPVVSAALAMVANVETARGECEMARLIASDGAAEDKFGRSVSISGDVAVVGRQGNVHSEADPGSAYVYRYEDDGGGWVEQAKLTGSAARSDFGNSVSASGDRIVISAPHDYSGGRGAAYVYRYDGSSWVEEARLNASDATVALFGNSVSASGDLAVIGAVFDDHAGYESGSAYVFRYDGSSWVEEAKLIASDAAPDELFGTSVSVSGELAVIGAEARSEAGVDSGAAYIYRYDGSGWVEEAKLTASDPTRQKYFRGAGSSQTVHHCPDRQS